LISARSAHRSSLRSGWIFKTDEIYSSDFLFS
jgi:hypothetical protein